MGAPSYYSASTVSGTHQQQTLIFPLLQCHAQRSEVDTLLASSPMPEPRPTPAALTDAALAAHVRGTTDALPRLTYLNLHNCSLKKIEALSGLKNLKV